MRPTDPTESAYTRAVESAWSRLRGRPVVLSPRDFELVASWRRSGVPLSVVLEILDHEARRRGGNPRSLGSVGPAVREAARGSLADITFDRYLDRYDTWDEETRLTEGRLLLRVDPQCVGRLVSELLSPSRSRQAGPRQSRIHIGKCRDGSLKRPCPRWPRREPGV